jgi:thiol-disulfide isomerase/thioredoxin
VIFYAKGEKASDDASALVDRIASEYRSKRFEYFKVNTKDPANDANMKMSGLDKQAKPIWFVNSIAHPETEELNASKVTYEHVVEILDNLGGAAESENRVMNFTVDANATRARGVLEKTDLDWITLAKMAQTKPVFAKFYMQWCGACKAVKDDFIRASTLAPTATFVDIHCEGTPREKWFCGEMGVTSFPTFMDFSQGKQTIYKDRQTFSYMTLHARELATKHKKV